MENTDKLHAIQIRVSSSEYIEIKRRAEVEFLNVASYVKRAALICPLSQEIPCKVS